MDEINADLRNKLQSIKIVLEITKKGEIAPSDFVDRALYDLDQILFVIDNIF